MSYEIRVTETAKKDLQEIFGYFLRNESKQLAQEILERISAELRTLHSLPNRGNYTPELERLSIHLYREIHVQPFRIVYQVESDVVFIHCVLDARRDVHSSLMKRLVR